MVALKKMVCKDSGPARLGSDRVWLGHREGGARFFFAVGARQVRSLTCCRPPPSIHCRKASRVRGAFFFAAGARDLGGRVYFFAAGARRVYFFAARAHSLTHSLPAARRAPTAKKHTQQKKEHGFLV